MTALASSPGIQVRQVGTYLAGMQVPIKNTYKIYMGAMVCLLSANGYAVPAGTALTGSVQGVAQAEAATATADGSTNVNLLAGAFAFALDGTNPPTIANVGQPVYAKDDNTISYSPGDGPVAGVLVGFEATSGWAIVFINAANNAALEGLSSSTSTKSIPLSAAILAAGTPMAAFADNAASNPGVTLANSKAMGVQWNDAATQVAIYTSFVMPDDIDTSSVAEIDVIASKTGATSGDAVTFDVALFKNAVGAAHDADTSFGGTTSAMTGAATAKTVQKVTLALAAANLGNPSEPVTLSIKPTNGTLGTDDVIVEAVLLKYKRKVKTS